MGLLFHNTSPRKYPLTQERARTNPRAAVTFLRLYPHTVSQKPAPAQTEARGSRYECPGIRPVEISAYSLARRLNHVRRKSVNRPGRLQLCLRAPSSGHATVRKEIVDKIEGLAARTFQTPFLLRFASNCESQGESSAARSRSLVLQSRLIGVAHGLWRNENGPRR